MFEPFTWLSSSSIWKEMCKVVTGMSLWGLRTHSPICTYWNVSCFILHMNIKANFFFYIKQQPPVGQSLLLVDTPRSHSDTVHSVGFLWTSDQPNLTPSWQYTTLTTDRYPCHNRNPNPKSQQVSCRGPAPQNARPLEYTREELIYFLVHTSWR
jgi:hypothetical protein